MVQCKWPVAHRVQFEDQIGHSTAQVSAQLRVAHFLFITVITLHQLPARYNTDPQAPNSHPYPPACCARARHRPRKSRDVVHKSSPPSGRATHPNVTQSAAMCRQTAGTRAHLQTAWRSPGSRSDDRVLTTPLTVREAGSATRQAVNGAKNGEKMPSSPAGLRPVKTRLRSCLNESVDPSGACAGQSLYMSPSSGRCCLPGVTKRPCARPWQACHAEGTSAPAHTLGAVACTLTTNSQASAGDAWV